MATHTTATECPKMLAAPVHRGSAKKSVGAATQHTSLLLVSSGRWNIRRRIRSWGIVYHMTVAFQIKRRNIDRGELSDGTFPKFATASNLAELRAIVLDAQLGASLAAWCDVDSSRTVIELTYQARDPGYIA